MVRHDQAHFTRGTQQVDAWMSLRPDVMGLAEGVVRIEVIVKRPPRVIAAGIEEFGDRRGVLLRASLEINHRPTALDGFLGASKNSSFHALCIDLDDVAAVEVESVDSDGPHR